VEVPPALAVALEEDKEAGAAFEWLSHSHRRSTPGGSPRRSGTTHVSGEWPERSSDDAGER
jgi:Bacteriocin-protection, YdeI or OmpD-Associated